jgi:hypothetical protein
MNEYMLHPSGLMEKRIDNLEFLQSTVGSVGKESMRGWGDFVYTSHLGNP